MSHAAKKIEPVFKSAKVHQTSYQWNRRILVVEDEPAIAVIYKDILAGQNQNVTPLRSSRTAPTEKAATANPVDHFNFNLTIVNSAEDALTEIRKAQHKGEPFAMGFFDVMLGPGKDGFELVKEIHAMNVDLYAVFVTAYNDRSVDSIHRLLGEDKVDRWDYLNKPFTSGEILQKARNYVSLWNLQNERLLRDKELSELQSRLLESERMASAAAVARGAGHEFGNLLMQIMGKADISLQKDEKGKTEALESILDASSKAAAILDRFKDLSTASLHDHPPKQFNSINTILDEALDLMENQFQDHKIKICRIKNEALNVPANPTSLTQVFLNVCINSIHAMHDTGQIDFSLLDLGEKVEIRIRDYGPGIHKDLINKVTDAFFTTKGEKGTGLGLAICKEIIEIEHQGEFRVQNNGVKGLEVIIRLPKKNTEVEG